MLTKDNRLDVTTTAPDGEASRPGDLWVQELYTPYGLTSWRKVHVGVEEAARLEAAAANMAEDEFEEAVKRVLRAD